MDAISVFYNLIKITPIVLILDVLLIIHFICFWYHNCYRKGYKIDPWHAYLLIPYFISTLIMYPFAGADPNIMAIGSFLKNLDVDKAFLITITGYIFSYIGFYYFNMVIRNKKKDFSFLLINTVGCYLSKIVSKIINNKYVIYILAFVTCSIVFSMTLSIISQYGIIFNMRDYAMSQHISRPLYNFIFITLSPIINMFIIVRFMKTRKKLLLVPFCILIMLNIFTGTRSSALGVLMGSIFLYIYYQQRNISMFKIFYLGTIFLICAFYLSALRHGDSDIGNFLSLLGISFFYGNTFSDVRDFAVILANWDSEYILGRSYLAGLMSFIPREYSEFRDMWSIGRYTTQYLLGFDDRHPGMRPGKFGEVYLNFGLFGVIVLGFIGGYVVRYIDFKIKENIESKDKDYVIGYSYTTISIFLSYLFISAGSWTMYVFGGIILIGYLLCLIFERKIKW